MPPYDPLADPALAEWFSRPNVQKHLLKNGWQKHSHRYPANHHPLPPHSRRYSIPVTDTLESAARRDANIKESKKTTQMEMIKLRNHIVEDLRVLREMYRKQFRDQITQSDTLKYRVKSHNLSNNRHAPPAQRRGHHPVAPTHSTSHVESKLPPIDHSASRPESARRKEGDEKDAVALPKIKGEKERKVVFKDGVRARQAVKGAKAKGKAHPYATPVAPITAPKKQREKQSTKEDGHDANVNKLPVIRRPEGAGKGSRRAVLSTTTASESADVDYDDLVGPSREVSGDTDAGVNSENVTMPGDGNVLPYVPPPDADHPDAQIQSREGAEANVHEDVEKEGEEESGTGMVDVAEPADSLPAASEGKEVTASPAVANDGDVPVPGNDKPGSDEPVADDGDVPVPANNKPGSDEPSAVDTDIIPNASPNTTAPEAAEEAVPYSEDFDTDAQGTHEAASTMETEYRAEFTDKTQDM
ncbi:hypothetical protein HK104_008298 [Borealophlyctis nickersoniae]|nr:hypothetical protein HK104_008298 [Borealophlyctis nickersoniae]